MALAGTVYADLMCAGAIWRLVRYRLQGDGSEWEVRSGRAEGEAGRFRLHCEGNWRLQVLLQQRDEHLHREVCRLRNCS